MREVEETVGSIEEAIERNLSKEKIIEKYELAAYLYVPPEDVVPREVHAIEISCGIPGVDEEELTKESKVNEIFQDFINLLEQEHDVYPGNFFRV